MRGLGFWRWVIVLARVRIYARVRVQAGVRAQEGVRLRHGLGFKLGVVLAGVGVYASFLV